MAGGASSAALLAPTQRLSVAPDPSRLPLPASVPPQAQHPVASQRQRSSHTAAAAVDLAAAMRHTLGLGDLGAPVPPRASHAPAAPAPVRAPHNVDVTPHSATLTPGLGDDGMSADMRALEGVLGESASEPYLSLPLALSLSASLRKGGPMHRARMTPLKRSNSTGSGAPALTAPGVALPGAAVQLVPWKGEDCPQQQVQTHSGA